MNAPVATQTFDDVRHDWTREELRALLVEHRGNISQVARVMGKDRVQIRRWIKLFALSDEDLQTPRDE